MSRAQSTNGGGLCKTRAASLRSPKGLALHCAELTPCCELHARGRSRTCRGKRQPRRRFAFPRLGHEAEAKPRPTGRQAPLAACRSSKKQEARGGRRWRWSTEEHGVRSMGMG
jgi:hypothetical protein